MSEQGGGASRSTDPAAGTSTATDVSLKEYLTTLITAAERRSDDRFESMKEMVQNAFDSSQEAIAKADTATEKRFESVNEFRATLADQARDFVTRQTLNALVEKLEGQIARNREDLDALAKRIDLREGQSVGSKITLGNIIALVTVIIAVISAVVVAANYLSGP